VRPVQYHHDLANVPSEVRRDAALVALADAVAKVVAPPRIKNAEDPKELEGALSALALAPEGFDDFCEAVRKRFTQVGSAY